MKREEKRWKKIQNKMMELVRETKLKNQNSLKNRFFFNFLKIISLFIFFYENPCDQPF